MANRTISLSPIGDLIRKKIVDEGTPFSKWVEDKLLEWNANYEYNPNDEILPKKPQVPWYYECQLCHQKGHHASECSMYSPVIEGLPEESQ